jgi:iron complex transport system substrate-binding protein
MALATPPPGVTLAHGLTRRSLLAALFALAACRSTSEDKRTSGARVVSLSPSTTEAVYALGGGAQLVGRSDYCDYPEEVKKLPSIGGYSTPDIEAIVALRPTLVVGSQSPVGPELERRLNAQGITTYFPVTDTIAEITAMLTGMAERLGVSADKTVREIEERVARDRAWAATLPPVRAVIIFDVAPVFVAGPGSYPDELARIVGGQNLVERGGKWPTLDVEELARLDPHVIVDAMGVGHGGESRVGRSPGWEKLAAVREGRVRALRTAAAIRSGPRITEALADMALALHGREPPT